MNTALKYDPLVSEFEDSAQEQSYNEWLLAKIEKARNAPTVSHEEAMNRLDAHRAVLLERMKNAD